MRYIVVSTATGDVVSRVKVPVLSKLIPYLKTIFVLYIGIAVRNTIKHAVSQFEVPLMISCILPRLQIKIMMPMHMASSHATEYIVIYLLRKKQVYFSCYFKSIVIYKLPVH